MKIQNIYKCEKYTKNDNLNKTCSNSIRCKIYYDEVCNEYKERSESLYCDGLDCAGCTVIDCEVLK